MKGQPLEIVANNKSENFYHTPYFSTEASVKHSNAITLN